MDFEKVKTDFEKRYDKKCEKIYFAGMGIELFSENANTLSGCLSIGEAMAVAKRDDGRITIQFSGTDSVASFNVTEIKRHRGERFARLLEKVQNCGIVLGGADIFIFKNTRITDLMKPLTLGGLSAFCENVPKKENLLLRFENFTENMEILSGRRRCVTLFDGQKVKYLPFFGEKCKVVITYAGGESLTQKRPATSSLEEPISALKKGDMEKFGYLLDKNTETFLSNNKCELQEGIFLAAKTTKDALGSGAISNGSVFSVVENNKVDRFIQGVSAEYQKHFGGTPDFYVTDFVDSGFFAN